MNKIYIILICYLGLVACKGNEDNSAPANQITPAQICESPQPEDMSGSVAFGDGSPASCTQAVLQGLIDKGGKISCNCGSAPFTLTLTSTLIVPNKEVIIDGKDILTISGNKAVRIFDKLPAMDQSNGTHFGLQNLTLRDGKAADKKDELGGGAIFGRAFGSMKVINVNFLDNEGPASHADACGAVHTILYKEITFANCVFKNNKGANGGAVGTIGSGQTFINCTFENNEASGTGGTFDKGGSGGAVYVDGVDQNGVKNNMSLCGCTFKNNKAGYQSGALNIIFYDGKGSSGSVDKCTFENNKCLVDKGGAYYHMNGPLTLTNSTFSDNSSPAQGGGLWISNTKLTMNNCTFKGNLAVSGDNAGGLGGAVCIDGSGAEKSATITNCTFAENRGGLFASAIQNTGKLTLTNSLFYKNLTGTGHQSNPYGGGTINKGGDLTVGDGNLQFPKEYTAPHGNQKEDWITDKVLTDDAQLQPLGDNEGPTHTIALPVGSPAIDKGTASGAPASDQRGKARKGGVDIGAYEAQ